MRGEYIVRLRTRITLRRVCGALGVCSVGEATACLRRGLTRAAAAGARRLRSGANLPRRAGERLRSGAAWRAARRVLERRRHSVSHRHRSSRATERESRPCYERPKDGELPSCASRAVVAAATTAPRVEYRSLLHMILFDARRVGERRRCSGTEGGRAPGPSASAPTQRASTSEQGRCSWHARRAMSVLII